NVGVGNETNGWNPHVNQWAPAGAIVGSSILEPLAVLDDSYEAKPWLAKSFTPNAAMDSWTIEVQGNVKFQDGTKFDAEALKVNTLAAIPAPLSGLAFKPAVKETTVVSPTSVRVDLNYPWSAFPTNYRAGQAGLMMAPAMLASADQGQ